jgi:hypothetical protein
MCLCFFLSLSLSLSLFFFFLINLKLFIIIVRREHAEENDRSIYSDEQVFTSFLNILEMR